MNPITFGSLFAGIGGIDLGFERCGMECKWQVEINDYAQKVLAKHWPKVHRETDIRECSARNLERVDIIAGGFPCQDISYAGLGAGLDGERSGLFFEAVRLVRELQPRAVVLENVAALLTRGLDRVLGTLAEVGYDAEWHCIPAAYVGAHFRRDRIFVIALGSMPSSVRRERVRPDSLRAWSEQQFTGLVEHQLQFCVPTRNGKRVSDGVSNRVDRLRGLGNAVVPQVAELVGKMVLQRLGSGKSEIRASGDCQAP
jgi:DNA (cytosine-5)-methyltransferase 1